MIGTNYLSKVSRKVLNFGLVKQYCKFSKYNHKSPHTIKGIKIIKTPSKEEISMKYGSPSIRALATEDA